jgi:hypothetical protein
MMPAVSSFCFFCYYCHIFAILYCTFRNFKPRNTLQSPRLKQMLHRHLFLEGPRSRSYGRTTALRLLVQPCDEDEQKDDQFFHFSKQWSTGGLKCTGENRSTRGKTCPNATLSTINPTWTRPGIEIGPPRTVILVP